MNLTIVLFALAALGSEPAGTIIDIPVGRSVVIELAARPDAISVTDPRVVEVAPLSGTLYQLQGRAIGSTDIAIVTGDEVALHEVSVQRDLGDLRRAIERMTREPAPASEPPPANEPAPASEPPAE